MKKKEIVNNLFSNDEFKDFLKNKIIHFKHSDQSSTKLNKKEIQDVKVFDSFCIPFENEEYDRNLFPKDEYTKYSLKDFDITGFNPVNSEQNILHENNYRYHQQPKFTEEYKCEFSDIKNTVIFENVLLKVYSEFYYFL